MGEDVEILDPDLAVRETVAPIALKVKNEILEAWGIVSDCLNHEMTLPWSITICTACPSKITVDSIKNGKPQDLAVDAKQLTGDYTEDGNTITVGTMADLKGCEFSLVTVVGCGGELLPLPGRCKEEVWRDALRLYVAMTRRVTSHTSTFLESPRHSLRR